MNRIFVNILQSIHWKDVRRQNFKSTVDKYYHNLGTDILIIHFGDNPMTYNFHDEWCTIGSCDHTRIMTSEISGATLRLSKDCGRLIGSQDSPTVLRYHIYCFFFTFTWIPIYSWRWIFSYSIFHSYPK